MLQPRTTGDDWERRLSRLKASVREVGARAELAVARAEAPLFQARIQTNHVGRCQKARSLSIVNKACVGFSLVAS